MPVRFNTLVITFCTMLLAACSSSPRAPQFSSEDTMLDGKLLRVTNADANIVYADPTADLSAYDQILIDPLDLESVNIIQPHTNGGVLRNTQWVIDDESRAFMSKAYSETLTRNLGTQGRYQLATQPGPGVLRISARITDVEPNATRDDNRSVSPGVRRTYTEGIRTMAIAFVLTDSENGEVIATIKDVNSGNIELGANRIRTTESDQRPLYREDSIPDDLHLQFGRWARMLRTRMDAAHG